MTSGSRFTGRRAREYRRYRPLPAVALLAFLGIVSTFIWVEVLADDIDVDQAVRCDPQPGELGETDITEVDHDALDDVTPTPPEQIAVQVLNAGGTRGQGAIASGELRQLGFTEIADPANDPVYADATAQCRGQIRYGVNGAQAARTLSLVSPCFQLIEDGRDDASVDYVVGAGFGDVHASSEARTVLEQLAAQDEQAGETGNGELDADDAQPEIDQELLASARSAQC